ncbi:unnamed protein product [Lota lota]
MTMHHLRAQRRRAGLGPVVRCVPAGSRVFVPCPVLPFWDHAEVSFQLNRSKSTVASYYFDGSKHRRPELDAGLTDNVTGAVRTTEMHLNSTATDGWARFAIAGVTAEDSGLYRCSAKVLHPAPVVTHCSTPTVHLHLEGHQCEGPAVCSPQGSGNPTSNGLWIWIGAMVGLVMYAVLVTILASVKIVRMKEDKSSQNDYMNTKHVVR